MNMIRILCLTFCILFFCAFPAAGDEVVRPMDLQALVRLALEKNLDLLAQTYETRASEAQVEKAYGIYDPELGARWVEGKSRDQLNLQFFSSMSVIRYREYDISVSQLVPTGAELRASLDNRRDNVKTQPDPDVDPAYDSELRFSLVQPLLRDFGQTVTEQEIRFAIKDRQISLQDLRERAFEVISELRSTYFNALRLRENLDYRKTSVTLAQKIQDENRARVDAGVLPPIEILEAEVGLKQRERELLDARRAYEDSLDTLSLLVSAETPIGPAAQSLEQPTVVATEEGGYTAALSKRPDVIRTIRQIERLDIQRELDRNELLPRLDLEAFYSHKALQGSQDDALAEVGDDDLANWEVGVNFSYPIGNTEARNELLSTNLRLKRQKVLLTQLQDEIRKEVRAALRLLEVSDKKIEAARTGRKLAEEKLRTLLKRKEVGLATTRDVLEGEEDLASAKFDETAALAEYNNAITDYLRVSGTLLEDQGVRFISPLSADQDELLLGVPSP